MVDSVTIVKDGQAEAEGHAAAMVAKAEGKPTPPQETTGDRPEWLPEKFKSIEDMAKAYAELEKKLSGGKTEEAQEVSKEETQETPQTEDEARETVENAGLDFDALNDEWMQAGELSEASYERLEKAGIPKSVVDAYIAGQQALQDSAVAEVVEAIGGQETFDQIAGWAREALSDSEAAAFDRVIDGGDPEAIKLAVAGLKARYEAANGRPPKLMTGRQATAGSDVYRSITELTADMKNPKYAKDAAFRADVEAKLARSNIM